MAFSIEDALNSSNISAISSNNITNQTGTFDKIGQIDDSRIELEKKRNESVVGADDVKAFMGAYGETNMMFQGMSKIKNSMNDRYYKDDEEFKSTYTSKAQMDDLVSNGLDPIEYMGRMSEAKNESHRQSILNEIKNDKYNNDFINETISPTARTMANATGVLLDIDTLLIGPVSNMLTSSGKISKIATASAGLETSGVVAKTYMSDDYDVRSDGLIDIFAGTLINTAIGRLSSKNIRNNLDNSPKQLKDETTPLQITYKYNEASGSNPYDKGFSITSTKEADDMYSSIKRNIGEDEANNFKEGFDKGQTYRKYENIRLEKEQKIKDRNIEIEKLENSKIVSKGKNKGKPKKISKVKQKEIDTKIQNLKNENELEYTFTMEEKLAQIKAKELQAKLKNTDIVSEAKDAKRRVAEQNSDIYAKQEINELKRKSKKYKDNLDRKIKQELEDFKQKEIERQNTRTYLTQKFNAYNLPLKEFFKKQDELISIATKEKDVIKAQKIIDEAREFEYTILGLADTVELSLSRLGRQIEYGKVSSNDIVDAVELLKNKFPDDYKKFKSIEKYIAKHRNKDIGEGSKILDEIVDNTKGLTKFQKIGLTSFLLLSPSILSANDGEGIGIEEGLLTAMIGLSILMSPQIASMIKNTNLSNTTKSVKDTLTRNASDIHYFKSGKGKGYDNIASKLTKSMSTSFNSSYKGLMMKADKLLEGEQADFAKNMIRKLLFNPLDGSITFDSAKRMAVNQALSEPMLLFKQGLKNYKRANYGMAEGFHNHSKILEEYNRKLVGMIEGTIKTEDEFKDVVNSFKKLTKQGLEDAIEAGVLGANKVKLIDNYFPRVWNFTEIKNILNNADEASKIKIANSIAKGMKGKNKEAKAVALLNWIQNRHTSDVSKMSDNSLNILDDILSSDNILKEDFDTVELRKLFTTEKEVSGRFKSRVDIDWSKVDFPEIDIKGTSTKLKLEDFIDRDFQDIASRYANDMYGKIHIQNTLGYPSVKQLRDDIANNIHNEELATELNTAIDILLNKPIYTELTAMNEISQSAKALTFLATMPFVLASMFVELSKTIATSGLSNTLKAFKHQINALDKDSLEFHLLADTGGIGKNNNLARFDFRGLDQMSADDTAGWWTTKLAQSAQQNMAKISGMIDMSDITQKANYLHHVNEFSNLVNGKNSKLISTRLDSYGIDESTINMFKDKFKYNDNGELLNFNKRDWTLDERTKFNDIMLRLNQEITPESMVGTTGLWMRSPLGRIASFLTGYPINLYENQAVKDAHYMDVRSLSNTVLTFGASYVGMVAKYEMLDRDYNEEDLIVYSLMNLPSASVFGAGMSVLDSPVFSLTADFKHDIEAITLDPAKEVFK